MTKVFFAIAVCAICLSCGQSESKTGILEACEHYKRLKNCENRLKGDSEESLDCKSLVPKFDQYCEQTEIDYALQSFKTDADTVCAFKTADELQGYTLTFDANKLDPACNQGALGP